MADYITLNETIEGEKKSKMKDTLINLVEGREVDLEIERSKDFIGEEETMIIVEGIKHSNGYQKREALRQKRVLAENYSKDLLGYVLKETLRNSLLFDKEYLEENMKEIENQLHEFIKESFNQELITVNRMAKSGSIIAEDIAFEVFTYANKLSESDNKDELVTEFVNSTFIESTIDKIAKDVQKKVKEVTEREKELSGINKSQEEIKEEEGLLKVDLYENTLFRSIYEACIPKSINESEGNSKVNSKQTLAETVFYYTLIECVSTMGIVDANANNINEFAKYIRNESKIGTK